MYSSHPIPLGINTLVWASMDFEATDDGSESSSQVVKPLGDVERASK
jgi:hypothetical protein